MDAMKGKGRVEREKTGLAAEKALGDRRMMFIMSDESPDRAGDIVKLDGWNLDGFMRNPVFLSMHDANRYPIGTWEKVWVEDGKLLGIARFADAGTHPEADLAYSLYKQGIMNAVSVKFLGDQYEQNEHGGLTFTSQELLECSAVPVPANANALAIAKDYDKRTREMFLRVSETTPDGTEEKADGTGDGSPIRGHDPEEDPYDGVHVSQAALDRILANLKIGEN